VITTRFASCGIVPVKPLARSVEAARCRSRGRIKYPRPSAPRPLVCASMRQTIVIEWVEA
jgi:hypothetical protein